MTITALLELTLKADSVADAPRVLTTTLEATRAFAGNRGRRGPLRRHGPGPRGRDRAVGLPRSRRRLPRVASDARRSVRSGRPARRATAADAVELVGGLTGQHGARRPPGRACRIGCPDTRGVLLPGLECFCWPSSPCRPRRCPRRRARRATSAAAAGRAAVAGAPSGASAGASPVRRPSLRCSSTWPSSRWSRPLTARSSAVASGRPCRPHGGPRAARHRPPLHRQTVVRARIRPSQRACRPSPWRSP